MADDQDLRSSDEISRSVLGETTPPPMSLMPGQIGGGQEITNRFLSMWSGEPEGLQKARRNFEGSEEKFSASLARNMAPFGAEIGSWQHDKAYQDSKQRMAAGTATDGDYHNIAAYERRQMLDQGKGAFGQAFSGLASIPRLVGETAAGGIIGRAAGAGLGLGAAGVAGAGSIGSTAGFVVPQTLEGAGQRAAADPDMQPWYAAKNLAPAAGMSAAQALVFGAASRLGGQGLPGYLTRVGTGMGAQQVVDFGAGLAHFQSDYGALPELLDGKSGPALQKLALQAVTIGVVSTMHGHDGSEELEAFGRDLAEAKRQGKTPDEAAALAQESQAPRLLTWNGKIENKAALEAADQMKRLGYKAPREQEIAEALAAIAQEDQANAQTPTPPANEAAATAQAAPAAVPPTEAAPGQAAPVGAGAAVDAAHPQGPGAAAQAPEAPQGGGQAPAGGVTTEPGGGAEGNADRTAAAVPPGAGAGTPDQSADSGPPQPAAGAGGVLSEEPAAGAGEAPAPAGEVSAYDQLKARLDEALATSRMKNKDRARAILAAALEGRTQDDIGREHGVKKQRVQQIEAELESLLEIPQGSIRSAGVRDVQSEGKAALLSKTHLTAEEERAGGQVVVPGELHESALRPDPTEGLLLEAMQALQKESEAGNDSERTDALLAHIKRLEKVSEQWDTRSAGWRAGTSRKIAREHQELLGGRAAADAGAEGTPPPAQPEPARPAAGAGQPSRRQVGGQKAAETRAAERGAVAQTEADARAAGIDPEEVHRLADQKQSEEQPPIDEHNKLFGILNDHLHRNGWPRPKVKRHIERGGDRDALPGLDEVAPEAVREALGWDRQGDDAEAVGEFEQRALDKAWDVLGVGKLKGRKRSEVLAEALDELKAHREQADAERQAARQGHSATRIAESVRDGEADGVSEAHAAAPRHPGEPDTSFDFGANAESEPGPESGPNPTWQPDFFGGAQSVARQGRLEDVAPGEGFGDKSHRPEPEDPDQQQMFGGRKKAAGSAPLPPEPEDPGLAHAKAFLGDEAGTWYIGRMLGDIKAGWGKFKAAWDELAGKMAPRTTAIDREAGESIASYNAAPGYAQRAAPIYADQILGKNSGEAFDRLVGATYLESRFRYAKDAFRNAGRADDADKVVTFVGAANSPFASEADYLNALKDPKVQEAIKAWKDSGFADEVERMFRDAQGVPETDPIDALTQIPGFPVSAFRVDPADPKAAVIRKPRMGNLENPKARKLGAAREATLSGDAYEINLRQIVTKMLAQRAQLAAQAKMYRTLEAKGLAQWVKPGDRPTFQGEPGKIVPGVFPPKDTQANQPGEVQLAVDPRVAGEVRKALAVDEPLPTIPGTGLAARGSLASSVEAASHVTNILSAAFRPGVMPQDFVKNAVGYIESQPEVMNKILDLARIGALKDPQVGAHGILWGGKTDPTYLAGKMIDVLGDIQRLTLSDAFDRLAKRPDWAGGVENTDTARRDFVNQVGQYNQQAQHWLVRLARQTGLGPFATAGTTFTTGGVNAMLLRPGVEARTAQGQTALRAEFLARQLAPLAAVAVINYLAWGRVDGDDKTPIGGVKIGTRPDGSTKYLNIGHFVPAFRGMRATGVMAHAEGLRTGRSEQGNLLQASDQAAGAWLHPFAGPAVQGASILLRGKNMLGLQVAEPDVGERAKAAALNFNPAVATYKGANRPLSQQKQGGKVGWVEPAGNADWWDLLGPFGIKSRKTPPGREPPRR